MSPKNALLTAGLTALGLFGSATFAVAGPEAPAPPGLSASRAPSPTPAVLLLSNGSVQPGFITEEETRYVLHDRGGKIPIPKTRVEKVFATIEDVYRHKLGQFPDRDPDEHLKLARWCLLNHLTAEAKAQLQAVLALSPRHAQAAAMLEKMENVESRAAIPRLDPAVVQSGGEVEAGGANAVRPEEAVNPADLRRMRRELGVPDTPQIFDLPRAQAVKRANEFGRNVHPLLQKYCARCHHEGSAGDFQLIQVKSRRDQTNPEIFRTNLDATLRLIDPMVPARSELLSSALVPHGTGPNRRPIFRGANDPAYQVIAAWVNSLRPIRSPDGALPAGFAAQSPPGPPSGEGFATDRGTGAPLPFTPTPPTDGRPAPPSIPNPTTPAPPGQFLTGSAAGSQPYAPAGTEFPVPYMMGGPKPRPEPSPGSAPAEMPPLPPEGAPAAPTPTGAETAAPKKKSKPFQLDPALLERALMNRNAAPR